MRLGIPTLSPSPCVPENREYRAGYLDGDTVLSGFSQVVQVTVGAYP